MISIYVTALVLGLAGSLHCAGMCGPIVLALPLHGSTFLRKSVGGLLYNTGRTITYGIMGAIFGLIGRGLHLVGLQQVISVVMGTAMIASVLFPVFFQNRFQIAGKMTKLTGWLKKSLGGLLSVKSYESLFFIGLLNGLLPCGLVYIAIAGAITTENALQGTMYMIAFGLGTIPLLLAIGLAGNLVSGAIRTKISRIIPILVVVVGIFFILRGLDLGIPYLSPEKKKIEMKFEKSLQEKERQEKQMKSE